MTSEMESDKGCRRGSEKQLRKHRDPQPHFEGGVVRDGFVESMRPQFLIYNLQRGKTGIKTRQGVDLQQICALFYKKSSIN